MKDLVLDRSQVKLKKSPSCHGASSSFESFVQKRGLRIVRVRHAAGRADVRQRRYQRTSQTASALSLAANDDTSTLELFAEAVGVEFLSLPCRDRL